MTAVTIRYESWIRQFATRAAMVGLLIAWKVWDIEGAGNVFVFAQRLLCLIWVSVMFLPATKQSNVRTAGQLALINIYRVSMVCTLAWYGHPGLAVLFLVGAFATEIEQKKYDENGVPLAGKGNSV